MTDATITPSWQREGEAIERAALAALHEAATPEIADALGLSFAAVGDAGVSAASALPAAAIVVNRAIGLGDGGRVDHAALAAVAARYRGAGVARAFIHLPRTAETPALAEACRAAGLRPARAWQKFIRLRSTRLPETAAIEIRPVDRSLEAPFARIACAAFDLGARAEAWLACLPRHAGWHGFVAIVDGEPAGTGALFVSAGVGWTDWGATAPPFRQRGIQRALLAHRLRVADAMGLARVHTCTGEAVPGDPQHSYANILRCGFVETALRPNWVLDSSG